MALLSTKRANKTPRPNTDGSSEGSDSDSSLTEGNAGWANSLMKVLKTTKPSKQNKTILARAKKFSIGSTESKKPKKPDYDFEVEGAEVKQETEDNEDTKLEVSALDAQLTRQQRKNVPLQLRVKPSFKDIERERSLRKVATRGTVQFFNAVRTQQKDIEQQLEDAGPLDSRQDAVLNNIDKRKFLDVLMSGKRAKSSNIDNAVKKEEPNSESEDDYTDDGTARVTGRKKKSEWSVLREDFMTNKKIKHWDEDDDDDDQENNDGPNSNVDSSDDD